ncbi:unnamed protein product, partial [Meganyctiphanes norvegica]
MCRSLSFVYAHLCWNSSQTRPRALCSSANLICSRACAGMGCGLTGATGRSGDSARNPCSSATQRTSAMVPSGRGNLNVPSMLACPADPWKPLELTEMPSSD